MCPNSPIASTMDDPTPTPGHPGPNFVIVGPLRAGTTMLRLMLHNHPELALVGEFEESVAMLTGTGLPAVRPYCDWLATQRVVQTRGYTLPDSLRSYRDIVQSMWSQLAHEHAGATAIGCTIHSRIDRVPDLWPDAKIICLVRDPRDVCRSCVGMGWYGHPAAAYPKWLGPVQHWEHARERLPTSQWTLVRYEDLLNTPEAELTKCAELLGVRYHPDMLAFHESSSYSQLDPNLAEQWRRKMSPRCAEIIDSRCISIMRDYGYTPSTPEPRSPSYPEQLSISFKDKLGRFRWRVNRYGLGLQCAWMIAKRLPITNPWRMKIRTRLNAIDHEHLR